MVIIHVAIIVSLSCGETPHQLAIARKPNAGSQRRDGFQRHVMGTPDGPFVVLFEQDRSDEANEWRPHLGRCRPSRAARSRR